MSSTSAETIKVALAALGFGVFFIVTGLKKLKNARKVQDTPRSKIATAPQGYVEFEGFAWPQSITTQLSSGMEAVYYSLKIERQDQEGSGKNKRTVWRTVFTHVDSHPFYVCDPTGVASIDLKNSQIELDKCLVRGWGRLSEKEKTKILQLAGTSSIAGFPPSTFLFGVFSKNFRVTENEICAGSPVYVHGHFQTEKLNESPQLRTGFNEFAKRVFHFEGRSTRDLRHLFDRNKDGKLCHSEAQIGYSLLATNAIRKQNTEQSTVAVQEYGTLGSSPTHKLFIADTTEEHLVGRLRTSGLLHFWGGALATTFGILFLVPSFINIEELMAVKTSSLTRPFRATATTTHTPTLPKLNPRKLHENCVQNQMSDCELLLENKNEFQLNEEQISFYKKRLGH